MACILLWSSALGVHDSQAYRMMDVTREHIGCILELREIFLSFPTGFKTLSSWRFMIIEKKEFQRKERLFNWTIRNNVHIFGVDPCPSGRQLFYKKAMKQMKSLSWRLVQDSLKQNSDSVKCVAARFTRFVIRMTHVTNRVGIVPFCSWPGAIKRSAFLRMKW